MTSTSEFHHTLERTGISHTQTLQKIEWKEMLLDWFYESNVTLVLRTLIDVQKASVEIQHFFTIRAEGNFLNLI